MLIISSISLYTQQLPSLLPGRLNLGPDAAPCPLLVWEEGPASWAFVELETWNPGPRYVFSQFPTMQTAPDLVITLMILRLYSGTEAICMQ